MSVYDIEFPRFYQQILVMIVAAAAACQLLVALWAATSTRHWFWRALAIWTAEMTLVPLAAYEPALIAAVSSVLTVVLVAATRLVIDRRHDSPTHHSPTHHSPSSLRFNIRDLLLATAIVGLSLVSLLHIVRQVPTLRPASYFVAGAAMAIVAWLAWASTASRWRWSARAALVPGLALLSWVFSRLDREQSKNEVWTVVGVKFDLAYISHWNDWVLIATLVAELAALLIAFLFLAKMSSPLSGWPAGRRVARGVLAALALAVCAPLVTLYWHMLWLIPFPPPFEGHPNHYGRLVKIAEEMEVIWQVPALTNEAAFLLESENFVPFDTYVTTRAAYERQEETGHWLRRMGRRIHAQAALPWSQGDQARAIELELARFRLGVMLTRGGAINDFFTGLAIQTEARARLAEIRRELEPDQARWVIAALRRGLPEREDLSIIRAREAALCQRAFGWRGRLEIALNRLLGLPGLFDFLLDPPPQREDAMNLLLQTDLAIRLFLHDHGKLPESLHELVPAYLPELPLDPYFDQPLSYLPTDDDFLLYSVGRDRTDDGGKLGTYHEYFQHGYDLDLDIGQRN